MILKNNTNKERGFTIVELLIVIVVIGILAAITIVAYNGVQNRARTTTAQSNAGEVQSKAEIYAADEGNGVFPTQAQLTGAAATSTAKLSPAVILLLAITPSGTVVASPAAGPTGVSYVTCGTSPNFTGAKIGYWDSVAGAARYLSAGTANATIVNAPTC